MICHGLKLPKESHSKYHRRIQVLPNEKRHSSVIALGWASVAASATQYPRTFEPVDEAATQDFCLQNAVAGINRQA